MDVHRSFRAPDFDAAVNALRTVRFLQNRLCYGVEKATKVEPGTPNG